MFKYILSCDRVPFMGCTMPSVLLNWLYHEPNPWVPDKTKEQALKEFEENGIVEIVLRGGQRQATWKLEEKSP